MAEGRTFICGHCRKSVQAWSDGNPYFIDEDGQKHHAYHPDHENLKKCIGNDLPHICLDCGHEFKSDSNSPATQCQQCTGHKLIPTFNLDGQTCPWCKQGVLEIDPTMWVIS